MVGKAAGDLGRQIRLGGLVGGGDRVALLVILEFDFNAASEVSRQDFASASRQFHGVLLDFENLCVVEGLHDFTLTRALSRMREGESMVGTPECRSGRHGERVE